MLGVVAGCSSDSALETATPAEPTATAAPARLSYVDTEPAAGQTSLRCEECTVADVIEVTGPDTLVTSAGTFVLYGAFVAPEEENCVHAAMERLVELAGSTVRLEAGPRATTSAGLPIRYVFTENGDSIDELLITEGLARLSAFEGPHSPWLLLTAEKARLEQTGCIWENVNRLFR